MKKKKDLFKEKIKICTELSESARDIGVTRNSSSRSSSGKVKLFSVQKKSAIANRRSFDRIVCLDKAKDKKKLGIRTHLRINTANNSSGMHGKMRQCIN